MSKRQLISGHRPARWNKRGRYGFFAQCQGLVVVLAVVVLVLGSAAGRLSAEERKFWKALQSGDHFVIMRHALAPGTGDPSHFKLGDCSTQRNLSDTGRIQAKRIGDRFRANGIEMAHVYTSQWCRCEETAELLALGPVTALPALNSFFQQFEREAQQTRQLKSWLDQQSLKKPLVLVTHQVNITALIDVFPASGEMIVVRRSGTGEYRVVGRIETEAGTE